MTASERIRQARELRCSGCRQCGRYMNPAEQMLGPICGFCVHANHKAVVEGRDGHSVKVEQ